MQIFTGDNYAVAGATTGHDNSNDGVTGLEYPGLQDQVAGFLASHQTGGADPDALYVVWAGANDFFAVLGTGGSPAALIGGGVSNTVQTIQLLWRAGARHIMVANVPDLGVTPFGLGSGISQAITDLSAAYNEVLEAALQTLAAAGIPTIRVDAFATLRAMANFPANFGFANVTEPFLSAGGNPALFLFWDPVHPTTRAHEVLADEALNCMIDYFSPRNGKGTPPARVNALKGLVRDGKGK
jgi:phospholipase/lecithinase/hemolysin